jgi:hypothetical protein
LTAIHELPGFSSLESAGVGSFGLIGNKTKIESKKEILPTFGINKSDAYTCRSSYAGAAAQKLRGMI